MVRKTFAKFMRLKERGREPVKITQTRYNGKTKSNLHKNVHTLKKKVCFQAYLFTRWTLSDKANPELAVMG